MNELLYEVSFLEKKPSDFICTLLHKGNLSFVRFFIDIESEMSMLLNEYISA